MSESNLGKPGTPDGPPKKSLVQRSGEAVGFALGTLVILASGLLAVVGLIWIWRGIAALLSLTF